MVMKLPQHPYDLNPGLFTLIYCITHRDTYLNFYVIVAGGRGRGRGGGAVMQRGRGGRGGYAQHGWHGPPQTFGQYGAYGGYPAYYGAPQYGGGYPGYEAQRNW